MFKFLYQFLFINQTTGKITHKKLGSIAGMILIGWSYYYAVINELTIETGMMFAIGVILVGVNATAEIMSQFKGKKDE